MRVWPRRPRCWWLPAAVVVLAACSDGEQPVSLDTVERVRAVLDGTTELCLMVAASSAQRAQGLQRMPALPDGVDGMAFVYPSPVTARFHMADTVLPLDIAFLDGTGTVVGSTSMTPCSASPCPTYGIDAPYEVAVETVAGAVEWGAVRRVEVGGTCG